MEDAFIIADYIVSKSDKLIVQQTPHTEEKPFVCSLCDKSFLQSDYLKKHKVTHMGEKKLNCLQQDFQNIPICSKAQIFPLCREMFHLHWLWKVII